MIIFPVYFCCTIFFPGIDLFTSRLHSSTTSYSVIALAQVLAHNITGITDTTLWSVILNYNQFCRNFWDKELLYIFFRQFAPSNAGVILARKGLLRNENKIKEPCLRKGYRERREICSGCQMLIDSILCEWDHYTHLGCNECLIMVILAVSL